MAREETAERDECEAVPADWPVDWRSRPATTEETVESARRRLTRLALAPGTGEDVAALTNPHPTRWSLDGRAVLLILGVLLALSLVVNAWTLLTLRSGGSAAAADRMGTAASPSVTAIAPEGSARIDPKAGEGAKAGSGASSIDSAAPGVAGAGITGEASAPGPGASGSGEGLVVYVSGAVTKPGVYRLGNGARVDDAVKAAGGLAQGAQASTINLAESLADGMHVHIPTGKDDPGGLAGAGGAAGANGSAIVPDAGGTVGGAAGSAGAGKVNINRADASALEQLPGVGPKTAADIVTYRDEHGPFRSVDELQNVPGIGPSKLSKLRENATI